MKPEPPPFEFWRLETLAGLAAVAAIIVLLFGDFQGAFVFSVVYLFAVALDATLKSLEK